VASPRWLEQVSRLSGVDTADVRRAVAAASATGQTALIRRNAPPDVVAGVEEWRGDLPGLDVVVEPMRRYPFGTLAGHLLGYAGEITDSELEELEDEGYRPGDLIGRDGVERQYEAVLRGEDGHEYVVVNALGRRVSGIAVAQPTDPLPGGDLVLTLDIRLQKALEEAMADVPRGAAVALDPRDGSILALVSRPAIDPNEFSQGLSDERWGELSRGGDNPLLNRAVQGVYPPGSTFKVATVVAGLRSRVVSRSTRLTPCSGGYVFGGRLFRCWEHEGHGSLDLVGALVHSCDVYFYQVGLRLGLPRLEGTARALGLGERTGVDLPHEARGLVPGSAWYDRRWGAGRWRKGLLLNLAIGQGELLATPLQLALLAAEAANGGHPIRPHLVRPGPGEALMRPVQTGVDLPGDGWDVVRQALQEAVAEGTGGAARVAGVPVAGKTGTAQNPHGRDHALFLCYAPADHPEVALAVVVENGGHGGSAAAPRAGRALRAYFAPDSLPPPPLVVAAADTTDHGD
jgi:penicillin-binding protein 2